VATLPITHPARSTTPTLSPSIMPKFTRKALRAAPVTVPRRNPKFHASSVQKEGVHTSSKAATPLPSAGPGYPDGGCPDIGMAGNDPQVKAAVLKILQNCSRSMFDGSCQASSDAQFVHMTAAVMRLVRLAGSVVTVPKVPEERDVACAGALLGLAPGVLLKEEADVDVVNDYADVVNGAVSLSDQSIKAEASPPADEAAEEMNGFQKLCKAGVAKYFPEFKSSRYTTVATLNYYYTGEDDTDPPIYIGRVINSNADCLSLQLYDADYAKGVCTPSQHSLYAAKRSSFNIPTKLLVGSSNRLLCANPMDLLAAAMPPGELARALVSAVTTR
jgi:hypothetical protein